jgi:hypothetical protein
MRISRMHTMIGGLAVLFLLAMVVSARDLSPKDMASTIGGGNCKICPGDANSTCSKTVCSFASGCSELSGGSYKVCAQGTNQEQNCINDDRVSCGTNSYCASGEKGCTSANYNCSCHSSDVTYGGCN